MRSLCPDQEFESESRRARSPPPCNSDSHCFIRWRGTAAPALDLSFQRYRRAGDRWLSRRSRRGGTASYRVESADRRRGSVPRPALRSIRIEVFGDLHEFGPTCRADAMQIFSFCMAV
jgi:hypothetical protein